MKHHASPEPRSPSKTVRGTDADERMGIITLLPAIALLVLMIGALIGLRFSTNGPATGHVVIMPPWYDRHMTLNAVDAAGAGLAGISRWPNVVLAYAPDADARDALEQAGAWLVLSVDEDIGCSFSLAGERA